MTDPLRKPVSGEDFIPSARQFGAFIDAAQRSQFQARDPRQLIGEKDFGVVLVQNDTGSDLTADRPIVKLGDPLIVPDDRDTVVFERPIFSGETPAAGDPWAILMGPLVDGAIGRAVVSGVTWAKVDFSDSSHMACDADGVDVLDSAAGGTGEILWRAGTSGEQWALVKMGVYTPAMIIGKTTVAHDKGETETIDIYSGSTKGSETTDSTVDAYNRFADVESGKWVVAAWIDGGYELISAEC